MDTHYATGSFVPTQPSVQPIAVLVITVPLTILAQMILGLEWDSMPLCFYLSAVASVMVEDHIDKDRITNK